MNKRASLAALLLGMGLIAGGTGALADSPKKEKSEANEELFEKGKKVFKRKQCSGCHAIDSTELGEKGPGLKGVYKRKSEEWIRKWLTNTVAMEKTDPEIIELKKKFPDGMPDPELSPEQLDQVIYFLSQDGKEPK